MDVLSEVLHAVKLEGAVFYNAEFSSPWGFISPASDVVAPYIGKTSKHVIIFHLLIDGSAQAYIDDGPRLELNGGDIVVFPHGHEHKIKNGSPAHLVDNSTILGDVFASNDLKLVKVGGGGSVTRFVCGYMACEKDLSCMLLGGLPSIFKVNIRNDAAGMWLENSIRFSANGTGHLPGGPVVLAKLSEVLFVETLRRYMTQLPEEQTGWLAGARDPEVGGALALLHREPSHPWTIADLAHKVGVSRSVLADRFRQIPWRTADVVSRTLAFASRSPAVAKLQSQRRADRQRSRLRIRSRLQSRLQARIRRSPRTLPLRPESRGRKGRQLKSNVSVAAGALARRFVFRSADTCLDPR